MKPKSSIPAQELSKAIDIMEAELKKFRIFIHPDGGKARAPNNLLDSIAGWLEICTFPISPKVLNQ